jgi:hypothetical protein
MVQDCVRPYGRSPCRHGHLWTRVAI